MSETSSSPATRRGVSLPRIQTSFTGNTHQRLRPPRHIEAIILEPGPNGGHPIDVPQPLVRRRSKGGLFDFLVRGRLAAAQKAYQTCDVSRIGKEMAVQPKSKPVSEPLQEAQEKPPTNEIHLPTTKLSIPTATVQRRLPNTKRKSKIDKKETDIVNLGAWDPPELFKAYTQSVRHVQLRAPMLHAETILLQYSERGNAGAKNDIQNCPDPNSDNLEQGGLRAKQEKEKRAKGEGVRPSLSWTEKIYVLTTSGCLLQYSGSGSFDRVPERIMSFGRHSAAFVSDAIPGQHYVLQVSRVTKEDGTVHTDMPRSIFKKLGFRSDSRRFASSFLLVFDSPEDMNEWLVILRKMIESVGGRKYLPDAICQTAEDAVKQITERPSRRYLIKRDPNRFADSTPHPKLVIGGDANEPPTADLIGSRAGTARTPSMIWEKPMDSPSHSYITTSSDQFSLEQLRGTPRLSYASAGAKTLSTSRGSSPDPSPAQAAFLPEDLIGKRGRQHTHYSAFPLINQSSLAKHTMMSSSNSFTPVPGVAEQRSQRRISTYSSSSEQTASWPPPNFSVPSFSRRFSCSTSASIVSTRSGPISLGFQEKSMAPTYDFEEKTAGQAKFSEVGGPLSTETKSRSERPEITHLSPLPQPPTFSDPAMLHSNPEKAIPHHYSSLACSREDSPCRPAAIQAPSPHPPPTTALPPLPEQTNYRQVNEGAANSLKQARRVSMQSHRNPTPRPNSILPKISLQDPPAFDEYTLSSPCGTAVLSHQGPLPSGISMSQPALHHRKTMPQSNPGFLTPSMTDLALLSEIPLLFNPAEERLGRPQNTRDAPGPRFQTVGVQ
jgi:hypothetical protein